MNEARLTEIIETQTKQLLVQAFEPVRQELANATAQIEQRVERELAVIAEHLDTALSCLPPTRKGH